MSEDLIKKLTGEIDHCDWSMLETHYENGAVFLVHEDLDLVQVGIALANDEASKVKLWQSSGQFRVPSETEALNWAKTPYVKLAKCLIIQPFVLIQIFKGN